jgi:hypothetical protein
VIEVAIVMVMEGVEIVIEMIYIGKEVEVWID